MPRLTLDQVETLAFEALSVRGAVPAQAEPVARSVRRAEADGIQPVGLGYLPIYLAHLGSGRVVGDATPAVTVPRPAVVTVDAAHGFAHPAFDAGLPALVAAARTCGTATMTIRRSYSIGVLGHPVEDIASQGLVALGFTNSPPNMTAWGGKRKVFGTNPLAFAVPHGSAPLVVDQASTVVTKVALSSKAATGERIPPHWAFDAKGQPTTDPRAALEGSMAPFGGVKGANIALLVELMGAVLSGATLSMDVHPYAAPGGGPPDVGQTFIALDPEAFAPGFADRLIRLVDGLSSGSARPPGDRRLAARQTAETAGIDVDDALLARIRSS